MSYHKDGPFAKYNNSYHVYQISESELVLTGGGYFYSYDGDQKPEIDEGTWTEARRIAEECGMEITRGHGEWSGWSEYTPDPGDISVFEWHKKAVL